MNIAAVADVHSRIAAIQARFATPGGTGVAPGVVGGATGTPAPLPGSGSVTGGGDFAADLVAAQRSLATPTSATTGTAGSSAGSRRTGGDLGASVVAAAREYLGVPYRWGGTDPATGLDCSGLTQLVLSRAGVDLPRVSRDQAKAGSPVASLAQARPGDLVFFNNPVDHVGIYIGDGKMIHAPRSGKDVEVSAVYETPSHIRRVLPEDGVASGPPRASRGADRSAYAELFAAAQGRHGVPAALLSAVARAESAYQADAVSPAGALGLMQIMPGTARELGVDPLDPAQAVDGAARLLRSHLSTFGSVELALAAYNAGPGAVRRYDGIPPYSETQNYVRKVMAYYEGSTR